MTSHHTPRHSPTDAAVKVPALTLGFWITKILATTMGETGGDALSMSMNLGYLLSTGVLFVVFVAAVAVQMSTREFRPAAYWFAIVASTTVGTTLADFADRSLGIGYLGGSLLLLSLTLGSLFVWYRTLGSIAVASVADARAEACYWVTIMFSQTLGTALGDWTADTAALGYGGAAFVFAGLLALVVLALVYTSISRTALFWSAFVLTRPLGAAVGDLLDKPHAQGGLELSRYTATCVLLAAIVTTVLLTPQRAASRAKGHGRDSA